MENSDMEDPNAYGYSVLAVPETIVVHYKLHSGKTTRTVKPLSEARKVVSCPYLTQAKRSPILVESSKEAAEVTDSVFKNVLVFFPLQTVYKEFLGLRCMIKKWDKELAEAQDIFAVLPPFDLYYHVMNSISILVLKIQESNPSSLKTDQTLQDRPRPANLLNHRLKLLSYPATCQSATENSLNSCQSAAKLVPMKTHTCKGDVTWITEVGEGPTSNLPNVNTGVLKPTLETLESNPDPPKTT
ncbi:hypothetical protein DSO57_1026157 [Entomophthora muscae]|uniref:Uncharacterized protein n=1 Tax=Entomophthora muscae TaxID=34485 RepID=A0ACC2UBU1_9FUNG|nr:hypothetical protein DSO57_1026157 [Entomophthora muscae]